MTESETGAPVAERNATPHLAALGEKARDYARNARAENTQRAYDADWRQFSSWLRRQGFDPLPEIRKPSGCISPPASTAGAERSPFPSRRWSGASRGFAGAIASSANHWTRAIGTSRPCSPGIRRAHGRPPVQKEAIFADDLLAMLATLDNDLRGLRDKAILAIGFAGGLRRSEIVGLDCGPNQSEDGTGWIEIFARAEMSTASTNARAKPPRKEKEDDAPDSAAASEGGLLLTINGKTGWREVEIGRGSRPDTCPVVLLETWMRLGRVNHGPLFRPIARKNGGVSSERLTDKHVARLVQKTALAAGIRGDLSEGERKRAFGGHSLRAGLASSAQIEEAHVQKHLGHASAEMTSRYQRKRDRFKVNLTKAAGL